MLLLQALVECEGGSIDLGGDMGAVGRVVISDTTSGDHEMYLDLKGMFSSTGLISWVHQSWVNDERWLDTLIISDDM